MAARKKRPVLYEVYRRATRTGDQDWETHPSRWSREVPGGELGPETPAPPEASSAPATPAAADRWQVTISGPTLAVLVAALVVMLVVTFSAGRHYGSSRPSPTAGEQLALERNAQAETSGRDSSPGTPDARAAELAESETAPDASVSDHPADSPTAAALEPTDAGAPQVALRKGYHYVIIQHFPKKRGRQSALEAARYLQDSGVACALLSGADIRLVATEAFLIRQADAAAAQRERERADQLLRRIKHLGRQFSKELAKRGRKGYTFADCYVFEIK